MEGGKSEKIKENKPAPCEMQRAREMGEKRINPTQNARRWGNKSSENEKTPHAKHGGKEVDQR